MDPSEEQFTPKKNWLSAHHILGYIFLIVVAAAIIAGMYYWQTVSNMPQDVQAPVAHQDETANWQTYTNDQYGFEFKYPSNWALQAPQNSQNPVSIFKSKSVSDTDIPADFHVSVYSDVSELDSSNLGVKSLSDYLDQYSKGQSPFLVNVAPTTLADKDGFVADAGPDTFGGGTYYFIPAGDKIFEIYILNPADQTDQLILSTFKFTNAASADTSTWQTYTNTSGGYSFQYPSDWQAATNESNSSEVLFGPGATGASGTGGVELIGTLQSGQTLADFIKTFNAGVGSGSTSETPQVINGANVIISILPLPGSPSREAKSAAFANSHGQVFNVYIDYAVDGPDKAELLQDFDQLLITFAGMSFR